MGLPDVLATVHEGDSVIVDGVGGVLLAGPEQDDLAQYTALRDEYTAWETRVRAAAHWPADTRDGVRVSVQANMERPEEAGEMRESGADGVYAARVEAALAPGWTASGRAAAEALLCHALEIPPEAIVWREEEGGG